jgi:hypothetical protein
MFTLSVEKPAEFSAFAELSAKPQKLLAQWIARKADELKARLAYHDDVVVDQTITRGRSARPTAVARNGTLRIFQRPKLFAASFAKISQRIHRAAVHHVPQFWESLISSHIGVDDHSSNFLHVLKRSSSVRAHTTGILIAIASSGKNAFHTCCHFL